MGMKEDDGTMAGASGGGGGGGASTEAEASGDVHTEGSDTLTREFTGGSGFLNSDCPTSSCPSSGFPTSGFLNSGLLDSGMCG